MSKTPDITRKIKALDAEIRRRGVTYCAADVAAVRGLHAKFKSRRQKWHPPRTASVELVRRPK